MLSICSTMSQEQNFVSYQKPYFLEHAFRVLKC